MNALISTLSLTLLTTPAPEHWQVNASIASYGSFPLELDPNNGSMGGYRFVVEAKQDGSLPLLQTNLATMLQYRFILLKKQASGKYAAYTILNTRYYWPVSGSGLLLTPGEYVYPYSSSTITPSHIGSMALLSGRWVDGSTQNGLWRVDATTFPSAFPVTGGGTDNGYRFTVSARPDGKQPVIDWCTARTDFTPRDFKLYRWNASSASYDLWIHIWDMFTSRPTPIAQLPPGDYAVRAPQLIGEWNYTMRYSTVLTGRYVDP